MEAYETDKPWTSIKIMEFAKKKKGYVSKCYGCLQDFIDCTRHCSIRIKKFFKIGVDKVLFAYDNGSKQVDESNKVKHRKGAFESN